jgi:chorismate mutase/prephenate dehydratase
MSSKPTLDDLRAEIDRIDEALHGLILRRADVAVEIGRLKQGEGGPAFRPSREAQILRKLAQNHGGPLPFAVIARLWREIMGALAALQGPLKVAVLLPEPRAPMIDLAREQFGALADLLHFTSAGQVLRAVADKKAALGLLPVPASGESEPWWPLLLAPKAAPRIAAYLPFAGKAKSGASAFLVAPDLPGPSGDDMTLAIIETSEDMSQDALKSALARAGLPSRPLAAQPGPRSPSQASHLALVEIKGYVAPHDPRPAKIVQGAIRRAEIVGVYARPLP